VSAVVRTVLGDVTPRDLGVTYAHEHLIIDTPLVADRWPDIHLVSVDDAVAEVARCQQAGVAAMVDAMPAASGRDPVRLAAVAERTGLHLVAATGLHTAKYYEGQRWTSEEPPDVLAALFVADVLDGIDRYDYLGPVVRRTPHRAGIVKMGWLDDEPSERDLRLAEAVAEVHATTGVAVLTHCEGGRGGLRQVDVLTGLGVPAYRIVLSHTDKVVDHGYHHELLTSGVVLGYDQALRQGEATATGTAALVARAFADGYGAQVVVGTDAARRSLWATHGGALGMAWLASGFVSILRTLGLDAAALEALFTTNPARVLAFDPPR
jgi:predicted metal-dependent phosphotriesterase family hydrolase